MPKIPWIPPPRPPRIKVPMPTVPDPDTLCPQCPQCGGRRFQWTGSIEVPCWVCKGTGSVLPEVDSPGDPFKVRDARLDMPESDLTALELRLQEWLDQFPETDRDTRIPSNKKAE